MWLPAVNRLPERSCIFPSHSLTDDNGTQFICRILPHPWSQSLQPPTKSSIWTGWRNALILVIVPLEFESYFAWSGSLPPAANPLQQTEWPPQSSLEINLGQDLRGPGRPDMMRRWYLWYGMSSRNLYKKKTETSQATYLASNKTFEFIIGSIWRKTFF